MLHVVVLLIISVFSAGYVAGFVDPEVRDRSDLFDVFVNLPDSEITVSQNAKGERLYRLIGTDLNPHVDV